MDSKDVRILAKKAMAKKNFAKAGDLKQDTWTSADAAAWKSFCFSEAGFSKYASKVPSEILISKDHLEVLKQITSGGKKEEGKPTQPVEPKPTEEKVEEPKVEEPKIEEPIEEAPAEEPVEEKVEESVKEEAPAEEPKKEAEETKKADKKSKK